MPEGGRSAAQKLETRPKWEAILKMQPAPREQQKEPERGKLYNEVETGDVNKSSKGEIVKKDINKKWPARTALSKGTNGKCHAGRRKSAARQ